MPTWHTPSWDCEELQSEEKLRGWQSASQHCTQLAQGTRGSPFPQTSASQRWARDRTDRDVHMALSVGVTGRAHSSMMQSGREDVHFVPGVRSRVAGLPSLIPTSLTNLL